MGTLIFPHSSILLNLILIPIVGRTHLYCCYSLQLSANQRPRNSRTTRLMVSYFQYPLQRDINLPCFTPVLVCLGIIWIIMITLVNVAVVGYENVDVICRACENIVTCTRIRRTLSFA